MDFVLRVLPADSTLFGLDLYRLSWVCAIKYESLKVFYNTTVQSASYKIKLIDQSRLRKCQCYCGPILFFFFLIIDFWMVWWKDKTKSKLLSYPISLQLTHLLTIFWNKIPTISFFSYSIVILDKKNKFGHFLFIIFFFLRIPWLIVFIL